MACGNCPQLASLNDNDLSRKIFKRKEKVYKKSNISIVTPSQWLGRCAGSSSLFKDFKIKVIPNGVDPEIFSPRDKTYSENLLNLAKDKILILFGAHSKTERKGYRYLVEALKLLKEKQTSKDIALIIFGNCAEAGIDQMPFTIYPWGHLDDEKFISCIYSAADMYVIPSLEDNLPNTVLESFACATPVIGFNVGGIPDMVKPHQTGLLAEAANTEELAKQIEWMVSHTRERQEMGMNARKLVEEEFSIEIQAKRYLALYESILKNKTQCPPRH